MSWLLFLDESGTDHGKCPYEVTGGVALHVSRLWPFIKDVRRREHDAFGGALHDFGTELKGCKLLERVSYKWAAQGPPLRDDERKRLCRAFLSKGREHRQPSRNEFTAYGQARLAMARYSLPRPSLAALESRRGMRWTNTCGKITSFFSSVSSIISSGKDNTESWSWMPSRKVPTGVWRHGWNGTSKRLPRVVFVRLGSCLHRFSCRPT